MHVTHANLRWAHCQRQVAFFPNFSSFLQTKISKYACASGIVIFKLQYACVLAINVFTIKCSLNMEKYEIE